MTVVVVNGINTGTTGGIDTVYRVALAHEIITHIFRSVAETAVRVAVIIVGVLVHGRCHSIGVETGQGGRGFLIIDDLIYDGRCFGSGTDNKTAVGHIRFKTAAVHFREVEIRITGAGIFGRCGILVTDDQEV